MSMFSCQTFAEQARGLAHPGYNACMSKPLIGRDAKTCIFIGAVIFIAGLIPLLDWFELLGRPSGWNVPRWLALIFALIFPSIGLFILCAGLQQTWKSAERQLKQIGSVMLAITLICFFAGAAIFFTWQTIAPFGESSSGVSVGGFPLPLPSWIQSVIDRFLVGIAALIMDAICIGAIWEGIRHYRMAESKKVPGSPRHIV
jgi:hypothetical protein